MVDKNKDIKMEYYNGLPLYRMSTIDNENLGIELISFVADPAIEIKGMAFGVKVPKGYKRLPPVHPNCVCEIEKNEDGQRRWKLGADCCTYCQDLASTFNDKQSDSGSDTSTPSSKNFERVEFTVVENDKQQIVGPAIIPDKMIYRRDPDGKEYYVTFSKEDIRLMVEQFKKNNSNTSLNLDHTKTMVDAFILESWIIEDTEHDKSRMFGFSDLPIGTFMINVKVEDKKFWNEEVKGKEKYGFSIEGFFAMLNKQELKNISIGELLESLSEDELLSLFD